jgi:hypothetical protein
LTDRALESAGNAVQADAGPKARVETEITEDGNEKRGSRASGTCDDDLPVAQLIAY